MRVEIRTKDGMQWPFVNKQKLHRRTVRLDTRCNKAQDSVAAIHGQCSLFGLGLESHQSLILKIIIVIFDSSQPIRQIFERMTMILMLVCQCLCAGWIEYSDWIGCSKKSVC